jgi:outer membrane receptor protein involved in Fe transport
MRVYAFEGRASISVVRYNIDLPDTRLAVSTAAKTEINSLFYTNPDGSLKSGALDVNDGSFDKTQQNSQGTEVELVLNPTPSWTLSANYAHNYLKQRDTLPLMGAYWSQLVEKGTAISLYPNLDSFVRSTRFRDNLIVGHLRNRANFFTRYNIQRGPLKGFSLGGGMNYRTRAYLGLVNNSPYYSASSPVFNALLGYSGRLFDHAYSLQLNVDNVTDKTYYVAYALGSARWSNPREFRLTAEVKF